MTTEETKTRMNAILDLSEKMRELAFTPKAAFGPPGAPPADCKRTKWRRYGDMKTRLTKAVSLMAMMNGVEAPEDLSYLWPWESKWAPRDEEIYSQARPGQKWSN